MNSIEEIAVPTSSPQLVEVLFGAYRRRILSLLLHPHQSYYLREIARLTGVLREALVPLGAAVRLAFVFGAIAQGDEHMHSRVDLMVLGSAGFAQVLEALAPAVERLRREINPVVMTVGAFSAKLAARDYFVARIAHEPRIFLVGAAAELARLTEHRAA